ncbi:unnamed protein product [Eruca vesicaria subsp. sativa]|uniref:F-box associated beta-propeller type 3 domain-containing protein n=1 Tax=Eruca vesicaria subsp. sativa TaxID=29727 RepID=A0ABC8J3I5_ERUVS|nr:unnamed protein product [Eruca vesicaria subsp. sativa]
MSFRGTNKAGEIIIVPSVVSAVKVQSFYIFYYNVRTNNVKRVRLLGIGDNEEFRCSYGFVDYECFVCVTPHHVDSIAFFKNHVTLSLTYVRELGELSLTLRSME